MDINAEKLNNSALHGCERSLSYSNLIQEKTDLHFRVGGLEHYINAQCYCEGTSPM